MKLALYAKSLNEPHHLEAFIQVASAARDLGLSLCAPVAMESSLAAMNRYDLKFELFSHASREHRAFDMLLGIGGDGTILDAVNLVRDSEIPVLGINTGRLGFLAALGPHSISTGLKELLQGRYTIDERVLLECESSVPLFDYNVALNDFVLHKRESSSMIVIHAYLNGEFMNTYWADGLIVSTPTGSTGYSLACGGPIIFPRSGVFAITPIAPHNLNVRPVVVRDEFVISFELEGRANSYMASLDSRSTTVPPYVQIAIRKADYRLKLVRPEGHNFLDTLRNKLSWGLDRRN